MQLYWEMGTYSHSGIESPIKVSFKSFIYCQYDLTSNKTQSGCVYIIEAKDIFQGKRLVDWHNHDNRLDNNNNQT